MFIGRPPLHNDNRYLRVGRPSLLGVSSERASNVLQCRRSELDRNCLVVGCTNQHKCLYSSPATEEQKRQWLHLIFNVNVPATLPVSLYVCANHFTSDCFSNEGQYQAGFALTLTLIKGSVQTIRYPATASQPQVSVAVV